MIDRGVKACIALGFCFVFCLAAFGQEEPHTRNPAQSCETFVTGFYTWYLELHVQQKQSRKSDIALKARPRLFSPELIRQLREDSKAQERAGSDLVSLDSDPFLGADGAAERYVVRRVTRKDRQCWAEVHGVWEGKENPMPDVTPKLMLNNSDEWMFINFYFPSPTSEKGWNLLDALKADRKLQRK